MVGTAIVGVPIVNVGVLSMTANTTSTDQVTGTYQHVQPGWITLVGKASATGVSTTLVIGGVTVVNDQPVIFTGTAGTISTKDNILTHIYTRGGRAELKFKNSTGGTLTVDAQLIWSPNP